MHLDLEALLVAFLLAAGTVPLLLQARRFGPEWLRVAAPLAWLAAVGAVAFAATRKPRPLELRTADQRPLQVAEDGYVSSKACRSCHPGEYDSWDDSYHQSMAQLATPETVLAPWDGIELVDLPQRGDGRYRLSRRGEEFWVELDDPGHNGAAPAPRVERQVVQTTGSHHTQLYWMATGEKRKLALLPHAFRIAEERWISLDAAFLTPPRGAQRTGIGRWNTSCQKCHGTHGKPRFTGPHDMDTSVVELGIACEMCHGPAGEHVSAFRDPLARYGKHLGDHPYAEGTPGATIVNPADLSPQASAQVCGQCHSKSKLATRELRESWVWEGFSYRPGDELLETRELVEEGKKQFWSDGLLRVAGREYSALVRNPCFQANEMSCLSCHQMHPGQDDPRPRHEWANDQLRYGMDGDKACLQCHDDYADEEALVAHTHHPAESSGSRCYDCHMPHTTYAQLGAIRNHDVQGPDVAVTVETGRPNACNLCHIDQTLAWTAGHLNEWYGTEVPVLNEEEENVAATVLMALRGDAGQRALMAWHLGWGPAREASRTDWIDPYLAVLMEDPYHAVRFIGHESAQGRPAFRDVDFDFLAPVKERQAALKDVLAGWTARPDPALLIDPSGRWMGQEAARLARDRDDSDVVLQE